MKKLATYLLGILSIFSICYYSAKFYTDKFLSFDDESVIHWIIVLTIVLFTLVLGLYNCYVVSQVRRQNSELFTLIDKFMFMSEEQCNNVLEATYNSRDIMLDTYNAIVKERK